jgi:hypothetical protein
MKNEKKNISRGDAETRIHGYAERRETRGDKKRKNTSSLAFLRALRASA